VLLTFGDCELDTCLCTLRRGGRAQAVEPLVFDLIVHLARQRERIVGHDELLDTLWSGKVVSESALSSCIKAARHAVGDDGKAQRCIATVRGRGYRFVAPVLERAARADPACADAPPAPDPRRRARIAVLPFVQQPAAPPGRGTLADALSADVTSGLARLRSLFVIAQGSMFHLGKRQVAPRQAAQLLQVDYLVSGSLQRHGEQLTVTATLAEAPAMRIVWTEPFTASMHEALQVRDRIASMIVASVAAEVELAERARALLKPPDVLDAWEAYHRGLWHMYRFQRSDNAQAQRFFARSAALDPGFAPAHAGLSFTHFQNAFQGWSARGPATEQALAHAALSLDADARNPLSHWAMGRALWLLGQQAQCLHALEQAVALSPSFALGHYTLAFVHAQTGDPRTAIDRSDQARSLSPFDPLLFGILGARAMALVRCGRLDEAAGCAVEAAAQPNAHPHILGIATYCLALTGALDAARAQAAALRRQHPGYGLGNFLAAFRFDADATRLFGEGARRIGMD